MEWHLNEILALSNFGTVLMTKFVQISPYSFFLSYSIAIVSLDTYFVSYVQAKANLSSLSRKD